MLPWVHIYGSLPIQVLIFDWVCSVTDIRVAFSDFQTSVMSA